MLFSFYIRIAVPQALGAAALCAAAAHAASPAAPALCPHAWEMESAQLQGTWHADIDAQPQAATLQLGPHPEWEGTVKGTVTRASAHTLMVGDVDQGNVTLEESSDGTTISATWVGTVTEGSCAREVRGQLQEGDHGPTRSFVLRKRAP